MRAVAQLRWRQARNRVRRLLRSPGWVLFYLAIALGFGLLLAYSARLGTNESAVGGRVLGQVPLGLPQVLSLWALVATAMAIQQGTRRPPLIFESADEAVLLPAPISPRQVFVTQLLARVAGHVGQSLLNLVWAGFVLMSLSYRLPLANLLGLAASFFLIALWADGVEATVWLALHRRAEPSSAAARAGVVRNLLLGAMVAFLAWVALPLLSSPTGLNRDTGTGGIAGAAAVDRLVEVAAWPPFSWFGQLTATPGPSQSTPAPGTPAPGLDQGGAAAHRTWPWPLTLIALLGLATAANGVAIGLADDYYEPALSATERHRQAIAAAHSSSSAASQDIQAAALTVLGRGADQRLVSTRLRPLGAGAWAMTWAQLVRYLRFERATFLYALAFVGLFGGALGVVVRGAHLSPLLLWALPLLLSLLNLNTGYLGEEFRRPQIYLIPDRALVRLFAASLVSWWDTSSTGSLMLWLAASVATVGTPAFGPVMLGTAAAWVLLLSLTWVTLGTGVISTILVAPWLPPLTRTLVSALLLLPALVGPLAAFAAVVYYLGSLPLAFLAAAVAAVVVALGLYALAGQLFDRLEVAN